MFGYMDGHEIENKPEVELLENFEISTSEL
jgi:hypothetical protein